MLDFQLVSCLYYDMQYHEVAIRNRLKMVNLESGGIYIVTELGQARGKDNSFFADCFYLCGQVTGGTGLAAHQGNHKFLSVGRYLPWPMHYDST